MPHPPLLAAPRRGAPRSRGGVLRPHPAAPARARAQVDQIYAADTSLLSFEELYRCVRPSASARAFCLRRGGAATARPPHGARAPRRALRRYSYNLVLYKHGEQLYVSVFETVAGHLANERARLAAAPDELLLPALRALYERHVLNMDKIKDVLMYLVRARR